MGERVSRLFQRTTVPEDTASTDSGDYTTASDEDTASGSNDESCADSVDSGGADYTTADEDIASDSSPGTSEGNVLLAAEHYATISPEIGTTIPTPSHQPYSSLSPSQAQETQPPLCQPLQASSSLSPSQAQEAQPHSHQPQASALSVSLVQPPGSHLPSIPSSQAQGSLRQPQPSLQSSSEQCFASTGTPGPVNSPESRALSQHSAKLFKAISASDQLDLAWLLFAKDLIGQEIVAYCQLEVTQFKKSSQIVCAVIKTVSASPHLFESLVSVLSESGNTALMSVGEKLKQTYEQTRTKSSIAPPHHSPSLPPHALSQLPFHPSTQTIPPPQPALLPSGSQQTQPLTPALNCYANYLKGFYTQSEFPDYSKWPRSPSKKYINLAIIHKEEVTKEEADEFTRATQHGKIKEVLKKRTPIKIEEVLTTKPEEKIKSILVEGAPGVGKSTFSWEMCKCWKKGLYTKYSIVLLFQLRDEEVQKATCLADLIFHDDRKLQELVAQEISNRHGKDLLILLDGFDELPSHLFSKSSIFARLLSGKVLPQATILVTSRPSATEKLEEYQISRRIQIIGFTEENINEYVQSVMPADEVPNFDRYLSMHPQIKLMLYVPLHCAISTNVYLQCQKSSLPPPKTLTGLYTCLTQTILLRYLKNHPDYKKTKHNIESFTNLPPPVFDHFEKLCKIAYENVEKQQLIFYDLPQPFEHLGFMDAVHELFSHSDSASYSYNFLHLSVQEYLAAYYISRMSHHEQEQLMRRARYGSYHFNMILFLAGITQLKHLNKELVKEIIGIRNWSSRSEENDNSIMSVYILEILYECQDVSILESKCCYHIDIGSTDSVHCLMALGYIIVKSSSRWHVTFSGRDSSGTEVFCNNLNENSHPSYSIENIAFESCTPDFTHQVLQHLPEYALKQVKQISIQPVYDDIQPLPPCLPELIPRMEKLNTLTLENVLDTSLTNLIPSLSRVSTLRNLLISDKKSTFEMRCFAGDLSIESVNCQSKFIHQLLPVLPQRIIKFLTIDYKRRYENEDEYESEDEFYQHQQQSQPLPSCLPELIPRMERLNTLTLENVLDTSLTELIPTLSRVPTLRNLTLHKLNSKGLVLICQWLPTCQLQALTLHEQIDSLATHTITINFCNNSIEAINCQHCTTEFTNQILSQIPQSTITYINKLIVLSSDQLLPPCLPELIPRMERLNTLTLNVLDTSLTELIPALSRVSTLRNLNLLIPNSEKKIEMKFPAGDPPNCTIESINCTPEFLDQLLPALPQQNIPHIKSLYFKSNYNQPLLIPQCLPELIPRMERLNTLTLNDVLDTSLTELIPALSRIPTLTNLLIDTRKCTFRMQLNQYFSTKAIECINCTPEFLDQLLPALPQQTIASIESLTIKHERRYDRQFSTRPIPSCLLEVIPRMENLDKLTLTTVLDATLTALIPMLSAIPTTTKRLILQITLNTSDSENSFYGKLALGKKYSYYTCTCTSPEIIDQLLQYLPQKHMEKIQIFEVNSCYKLKPLPPCLPKLIPKMKTLNTLTLWNVTSQTELIPALSKVPTMEKLTLHYSFLTHAQITITFFNNSIGVVECRCCTTDFIDQILQQLFYENDENTDSHSTLLPTYKTLTTCNIYYRNPQPLPCLIKTISRMERLNTLTLENVLDTSLTELIPALFRVPTLRNLKIQTNTEKFKMLFPSGNYLPTGIIKSTTELFNLFLPQLQPQTIAHIRSLTVTISLTASHGCPQPLPPYILDLIPKMESLDSLTIKNTILDDTLIALIPMLSTVPVQRNLSLLITLGASENKGRLTYSTFENVCTCKCTSQEIDQLLQLLPQQHIAQIQSFEVSFYTPKPLPRCLSKLISRMERLNTLILENIVVQSLKFGHRCWTINSTDCKVTIIFCNKFIESIECQYNTADFIDQILSQIPQQSLAYVKMFSICNADEDKSEDESEDEEESDYYEDSDESEFDTCKDESNYQLLPIPPCLPKMILRMEGLNTLTLENILDTSLTRQIWLLSRIHTLRNLTLRRLDSEGIVLLCQWLSTCRLEKLKLPSLSPDHIEMVSQSLTTVSSLKTLDIQNSWVTVQSMLAFVSMLQQNQSLTEVNVSECSIDSDSACCLAKVLHHNTTLRKLDMSKNPVEEWGALAMAEMFKHNTTLKELDFSKVDTYYIFSDGAVAIAKALHHNTTLRKLDMSWNSVGERGALAMAEMLKHNTTLEELDLRKVNTNSDGAVAIARALHHNTTLRKLDMSWNPVEERGASAMAEMLKHNTTLEELDLRVSSSNSGITALIESLAVNQHLEKLIISEEYEEFVTSSLLIYSAQEDRVLFDY